VKSPTSPSSHPRALSTAQQTRLRTRLVAQLQELRELEERLQLDIAQGIETRRGAQNDETDDPEGASLAFEGAQSSAMLGQSRRHTAEIIAALERLDGGRYGRCVECESTIAPGRLDARPATAHCIHCAS
jgi:DnaK suppressor protein